MKANKMRSWDLSANISSSDSADFNFMESDEKVQRDYIIGFLEAKKEIKEEAVIEDLNKTDISGEEKNEREVGLKQYSARIPCKLGLRSEIKNDQHQLRQPSPPNLSDFNCDNTPPNITKSMKPELKCNYMKKKFLPENPEKCCLLIKSSNPIKPTKPGNQRSSHLNTKIRKSVRKNLNAHYLKKSAKKCPQQKPPNKFLHSSKSALTLTKKSTKKPLSTPKTTSKITPLPTTAPTLFHKNSFISTHRNPILTLNSTYKFSKTKNSASFLVPRSLAGPQKHLKSSRSIYVPKSDSRKYSLGRLYCT
ncbi:unnamed protein product [Moneuplotes crassus]|uniref:Uncharacterized protein n=1 Tax=Euplotes crassus TaxID=5936 RepID=A0AAD1XJQ4_EUPCR|nr:unnamed protein product [Moneuplotes crassus]